VVYAPNTKAPVSEERSLGYFASAGNILLTKDSIIELKLLSTANKSESNLAFIEKGIPSIV
jgi:hypothetical protein